MRELGTEDWVLGDEGPQHVVLQLHFELTEREIKWLRACADARGVGLEQELRDRALVNDDECELIGYWEDNDYRCAAEVMNAALAPYAAAWPAPKPFRIDEEVILGQMERVPVNADEWRLVADRWCRHLTAEGVGLFDLALAASLALDGAGAAKWVELASQHVLPDLQPTSSSLASNGRARSRAAPRRPSRA